MKLLSLLLTLASIEGISWWWMHPTSTGQQPPVLVYRPSRSAGVSPAVNEEAGDRGQGTGDRGQRPGDRGQETGNRGQELPGENSAPSDHQSKISPSRPLSPSLSPSPSFNQKSTIHNPQSSISPSPSSLHLPPSPISASQHFSISAFTRTPLPELYAKAAPMLRCSSGQVSHVRLSDTFGLHLAFFEWDESDTGSVLEAFRHMPEDCLGSIGMALVSKEKPILYTVGPDRRADPLVAPGVIRERNDKGQSQAPAPEQNPSNSKLNIQNSTLTHHGVTLVFDHTIFRDPGQGGGGLMGSPPVHSFRAVWVSGMSASDARTGIAGEAVDQLRTIRLKSALNRYRPSHARVIQGAVRGALNSQAAWQAFESTMLVDLKLESQP